MISIGNLQINKLCLGNLEVAKAYLGDVEVYGSTPQPVGKYMTITALDGDTGTTISPKITGTLSPNLQYRINNGDWTDFVFGTTADIKVVAGDFVQWKGNNPEGISTEWNNYLNFSISGNPVHLSGNVMSLIDGVGDSTVIPNSYCFGNLFLKSSVKTVSQDFLPATTLQSDCYRSMFEGCTSLETAPELPATTLAGWCYSYMFSDCTSLVTATDLPATNLYSYCYYEMFNGCTALVTAPALPATKLYSYCYYCMFKDCTSLTTAPELPATTLANHCYEHMFQGCTSLTTAPALPATELSTAGNCYYDMFNGCTALVTAPELPATRLSTSCYASMFCGCTSLTTAPELPSTTLANNCYQGMFQNCTSLTTAPELPAMTLKERCYYYMFYGCSLLTQAPALHATTLADNCYHGMFQGCTSLVNAPELPATTLAPYCYAYMFYDCSSIVNAPELPATMIASNCYRSMFYRCTSLNQAPVLPALNLAEGCYQYMFYGASKLNYVKSLATNITATNALNQWLSGVAASGTFVKPMGVGYPTGASGIPNGWTVVEEKPKPEGKYMTITVDDSAGETTISPTINGTLSTNPNLQYRVNSNDDWTDFIIGTTADIHVVAGDWVQFKGNNQNGISTGWNNYLNFSVSDLCHLSGNVMSLIDGIGDTTVIPNDYCFSNLFFNSKIKTVSKDFLPATTIATACYFRMFGDCTSLTTAPELPATTLAEDCYRIMFTGCTSLVNAPEILPATTIATCCYLNMFGNCTSLTTAPVLTATKLSDNCYQSMFSGCSKLSYVKSLATSGTINNGGVPMTLYSWLYNVASSGTFVKPAGVEYVLNSSGGIPKGWTIQNI